MDIAAETGEPRCGLRIPVAAGNHDYTDLTLQVANPDTWSLLLLPEGAQGGCPKEERLTWEQSLSGTVVRAPPTLSRAL